MGTRDSHPGESPEVITFGWGWGERVPRRWAWMRVRVPRRWPWVLGAVLLAAAVAVLIAVRPLAAAADFRALQARWSAAVGLDLGRIEVIARLTREATPSDVDGVTAAVLAVQRQEADRLVLLRSKVTPGLARDSTVGVLAAAERAALSHELADLRGSPLIAWSVATELAIGRVQTLLAAGQRRFGVPAPASPRPARLTAADNTLLRLQRLLDDRVPVRLLVADGSQVQLIDLRAGRVTAAPSDLRGLEPSLAQGGRVLRRAGFLAVQAGEEVYAVKPALAGRPRRLGAGQLLPAGRPGAVWIWSGWPGHLVLVSGTGRRIAGPVRALAHLPGSPVYFYVTGLAVSGGLVVEKDRQTGTGNATPAGLWLWNPLRGQQLRPLAAGCAHTIAAQGRLLAWVDCARTDPARVRVHVTDTATGAERVITSPPEAIPFLGDQPTAAFSPNGKWLAAYYSATTSAGGTTSTGYALGLVNTRTGAASIIRGAPVAGAMGTPIMWSADSARFFFATGGSSFYNIQPWADSNVPLATYRIGAPSAADLRLHEPSAALLAVVPASAG